MVLGLIGEVEHPLPIIGLKYKIFWKCKCSLEPAFKYLIIYCKFIMNFDIHKLRKRKHVCPQLLLKITLMGILFKTLLKKDFTKNLHSENNFH